MVDLIKRASLYLEFWRRLILCGLKGGYAYRLWLSTLGVFSGIGFLAYSFQIEHGLIVTNLSNQVAWGAYIANFTYIVGILAVAVLLVVPAFLMKVPAFEEIVYLGQLLALSCIIMALLFITVDLGHPERFLHIIPFIGKLNFPGSILAWDTVVLNGYLIINFVVPNYMLYKIYMKESPRKEIYLPFVLVSVVWAVSIHTVSAFLYSGLGGRPHWNSAVLAPRFLISAFACGPAVLIIIFKAVHYFTEFKPRPLVFKVLQTIMVYTLLTNLFLFGCEIFKEFYTDSAHLASLRYLLFGLHGHGMLVPYIWGAIIFEIIAAILLILPQTRDRTRYIVTASALAILGIWVEKGMGLIVPGFIPTPLGDLVEYTPSKVEFFVCLGIWAMGALIYTVLAKGCIGIQTGKIARRRAAS